MVSRPTTVDGVTSKPTIEYTPAVSSRSCSSAPSAAVAIRHSWNRSQMNAPTATRNTTRARIAWLVTSLPHDSDTFDVLTSFGATWPALARLATTFSTVAWSFGVDGVFTWNVRAEPL